MPSFHLPHRRRSFRIGAFVFAVTATLASTALAGERPADRSLADAARTSLLTAASRMVERTRDVALFALSLVGIDYRYGGDTPEQGLDCSGLIHYAFQEVTGVVLPRTSRELSRIGKRVGAQDLEPGDLVFFNTRRRAFSHVGIYLGDDRFIHAPSKGGEVNVAVLSARYWRQRYDGARRLSGVLPALLPNMITRAEASTGAPASTPAESPLPPGDAGATQAPVPPAFDIQP